MECFFKSELCGTQRSYQTEGSLVNDLDVSGKEYLISFKLMHCHDKDSGISEKQLIESGCNVNFASDHYLCAYHRCIYGTYWKPPKNYLIPEHQKTTGKQPASHPATIKQPNYLTSFYKRKIPIGVTLCTIHMKLIKSLLSEQNKDGCDLSNSNTSVYEPPCCETLSHSQICILMKEEKIFQAL